MHGTAAELDHTANAGVARADLAVKLDILLELIHIRYTFIGDTNCRTCLARLSRKCRFPKVFLTSSVQNFIYKMFPAILMKLIFITYRWKI
jgi:hypothetical protein